jgi:putative glutamine amidotransferase
MKRTTPPINFISLLFAFLFAGSVLFAQNVQVVPPRFFDSAPAGHGDIRLVVCHPSTDSIKDLMALKEQGLFNFNNVTVIGVYHVKEKTDYTEAEKFVRENNLDWMKFHGVSAAIPIQDLFKNNACSAEFAEIFRKSDGLIFFGGPDIPPAVYKEKTNLLTIIEDPNRHFFETSFIFHLLGGYQNESFKGFLESRPSYPVLGICLGAQSLNIGTGGSLTQDIWAQIYGKDNVEDIIALGPDQWHTNPYDLLYPDLKLYSCRMHPILLSADGKFCREFGFSPSNRPLIYSAHHQQVKKPGKGFRVIATSLDGKVAEAIEHEKYLNVLGVQFHPESTSLWDASVRHKMAPEDKEPISLKSILDQNPPSLEFHKKLWGWFSAKLREEAKKR